jgi:hypothetical protein
MKTTQELMKLLAGKYNPMAFAVYCIFDVGISKSSDGIYHFTSVTLMHDLSYMVGFRPKTVTKETNRTIINSFWADGLFDFKSNKQGYYVRHKSDVPWPLNYESF